MRPATADGPPLRSCRAFRQLSVATCRCRRGVFYLLHGYQTGTWYPFHKNGHIDDPKSTASVGAMLTQLCANHSIPNFHFRTSALKPYSTIRHIGTIDMDNLIHSADIVYRHIESENGQIKLPTFTDENGENTTQSIIMRGDLRLGYRQLDAERWAAAPLYTLRFSEEGRKSFPPPSRGITVHRT